MDERLKQLLAKGREHYEKLEFEEAEPYLREVAQLLPDYADVHNMLGVAQFHQGKKELAQRSFERSLLVNPRYTEAALNLAVVYNELGRYQEGLKVHTGVVAAAPEEAPEKVDPFAQGKVANMHADIARAYEELGMYDRAVAQYQAALDLCPDFADLRTRLGHALQEMGDLDGACAAYRLAADSKPSYVSARVYLGLALYQKGQRDEAVKCWQEVVQLDPSNRLAQTSLEMARQTRTSPDKK